MSQAPPDGANATSFAGTPIFQRETWRVPIFKGVVLRGKFSPARTFAVILGSTWRFLATPAVDGAPYQMKSPPDPKSENVSPVAEALKLVQLLAEASAQGLAADGELLEEIDSSIALKEAISEAELSVQLRAAVESAASRSDESMDALRVAVCAFTVALRNEGIRPEAVLIQLKAAIREETLSPLWMTSTWSGPRLRETITTWCIQDYFRSDNCAH